MLALQYIRDNADAVRAAAVNKGVGDAPVDRILELDENLRRVRRGLPNRTGCRSRSAR